MFAKGNPHADGAKLVSYIMTGKEGERVEFGEARGFEFFHDDVCEAARLMDRMAGVVSKAESPWFHTQTRLPADERLTRAQWEQVVDRQEKVLGFTGQPRIWAMHVNEATGERHLHVAWYRIDVERECAIDPGLYKNKLKFEVSRYLEKQLGLRRIGNERQEGDRARYADRREVEESRRLGTDVRAIRAAILDCLEQSDGGKAFKAALEARSMALANGDRRDCFVVIDAEGGHHALNKKLTNLTLAETRTRLADLDRTQLPHVEQAKALQAERHAARTTQEARQQPEAMPGRETRAGAEKTANSPEIATTAPPKERPLNRVQSEIRLVLDGADSAQGFADALKDRGFILAEVRTPELQRRDAHELKALLEMKANGVWMLAGDQLTSGQVESAKESYAEWIDRQPKDDKRKPFSFERYVSFVQARNHERLAELQQAAAAAPQRAEDQSKVPILPRYAKADDLVVIDQRGSIYTLNRRVTGRDQKELKQYFAGIDRTQLMSVTDAQTVMRGVKEQQRIARAQARIKAPLNKTVTELRAAWNGSQLDEALAARGFSLAAVTAAEAEASRQKNAEYRAHQEAQRKAGIAAKGKFADLKPKEPVRYAPVLKEGQIVAVNRFSVYSFDERTTGQMRPEIDARLATIDRATLRSITDTQTAMKAASLETWKAERRAARAQARINAPLGKTAGQIRMAWVLSSDADRAKAAAQFEDALASRGLSLAAVTAAEAEASRQKNDEYRARKASTARGRYADLKPPEPARYAPVLTEGEIVVIDGFGAVHRLDEHTSGQMRPEIDARLATIDRATLMNVADTQVAMRAASLAAWKAEQRAKRERVRLPNWIEQKIADCANQAQQFSTSIVVDKKGQRVTGAEIHADRLRPQNERQLRTVQARSKAEAFAARLDDAGITIVRVTAADERALAALRHDEAMKQHVAETNAESYRGNRFADVLPGELAAVTSKGDVYRVNPDKMRDAASLLPEKLPGVVEARAAFEINTARTDKLYADRRAETEAKRAAYDKRQDWRQRARIGESAVHATFETPATAVRKTVRKGLGLTGLVTKTIEVAFSILSFGGMGGPKQTAQQRHDKAQARGNRETLHAFDVAAEKRAQKAQYDDRHEDQKKAQQEQDLSFAQRYGTPPTREANPDRDRDYERERER